ADVALDRLLEDPLAADARLQHLRRDLALAEPRHLDRAGQVRGRVFDRMLEVLLGDLDGQTDGVVGQLLDLRRHRPDHSSKEAEPDGESQTSGSPSSYSRCSTRVMRP